MAKEKSQADKSTVTNADSSRKSASSHKAKKDPNKPNNILRKGIYSGTIIVCLALLGVLGYFYYELVMNARTLAGDNQVLKREFEELSNQQQQSLNRVAAELEKTRTNTAAITRKLNDIDNLIEVNQANIDKLKKEVAPEELWRLQLTRLLYMAEQERIMGNRPSAVNYLLLEAEQIALAAPTNALSLELRQVLAGDLENYQYLLGIETSAAFNSLQELENIVQTRLEFNSDFYRLDTDNEQETEENQSVYLNIFIRPLVAFYQEFAQYIRINTDREPGQILSRENRELTTTLVLVMLNQAKNSLIRGEEEIYSAILEELRDKISATYIDNRAHVEALALLDSLATSPIIPFRLPPLQSYGVISNQP